MEFSRRLSQMSLISALDRVSPEIWIDPGNIFKEILLIRICSGQECGVQVLDQDESIPNKKSWCKDTAGAKTPKI